MTPFAWQDRGRDGNVSEYPVCWISLKYLTFGVPCGCPKHITVTSEP